MLLHWRAREVPNSFQVSQISGMRITFLNYACKPAALASASMPPKLMAESHQIARLNILTIHWTRWWRWDAVRFQRAEYAEVVGVDRVKAFSCSFCDGFATNEMFPYFKTYNGTRTLGTTPRQKGDILPGLEPNNHREGSKTVSDQHCKRCV